MLAELAKIINGFISWLRNLIHVCSWRRLILRIFYFIVGLALGIDFLGAAKHFIGFDDHVTISLEILISLICGVCVFLVSEPLIHYFEYSLPHPENFELRKLILNFVKNHPHFDPEEKARVALSFIIAEEQNHEFVLTTSFINYLKLLSAATSIAEREWFATYRLPISLWNSINKYSINYFRKLGRRKIIKSRVVIRPKSEIRNVDYNSDVVIDTIKNNNAKLVTISQEDLEIPIPDDYALFDEELVITARPEKRKSGSNDDPYTNVPSLETEMQVRLLKGDKINEFVMAKQKLNEKTKNYTTYTRRGLEEHLKKTKITREK